MRNFDLFVFFSCEHSFSLSDEKMYKCTVKSPIADTQAIRAGLNPGQRIYYRRLTRLATSLPLGELGEPFLAAKLPTASDEVAPFEVRRRTFLKVYRLTEIKLSCFRFSPLRYLFPRASPLENERGGKALGTRLAPTYANWGSRWCRQKRKFS